MIEKSELTVSTPTAGLLATPASKLRAPSPQIPMIARRHVLDKVAATRYQIVAIDGPGGFGKSTLAAQWARESPIFAWATLDPSDSDPVVLVSTLLNALSAAVFTTGSEPGSHSFVGLSGDEPSFSRWTLPQFRLLVESAKPTTLVIDNVDLAEGPAAVAVMVALVESLPPGCSVALVGRSLGRLPISRWYVEGRLVQVGPEDLSFSEPEVGEVLEGFVGEPPSQQLVTEVLERTGGWPVAVYLDAAGGARRKPISPVGTEEYVHSEIVAKLDPALADFLRRTSPLDALTPALCDAVLQEAGTAGLLVEAESEARLLHRLEGRSHWYRLHDFLRAPLLADLLRREPSVARDVHARASLWFRQAGLIDPAVSHALASGDLDLMGETLWLAAGGALLHGQGERVRRWLSELDEPSLARHPGLSLTAAWTAISFGEFDDALRWAAVTADLLEPNSPTRVDTVDTTIAPGFSLLVSLAGETGWKAAAEMARSAQLLLPVDNEVRIFGEFLEGWYTVLVGDVDRGLELMEHARSLASSHDMGVTETEATALLALVHAQRGEFGAAWSLIDAANAIWKKHDRDGAITTSAVLAVATTFVAAKRQTGDCQRSLTVSLELAPKVAPALPWYGVIADATAALCMADCDQAQATAHLRAAEQRLAGSQDSPFLRDLVASAQRGIEDANVISQLSPAERRVWELLAGRMTVREIADSLFLSPETVKSHTSSIYRKLNVATRREAQELAESLVLLPSVSNFETSRNRVGDNDGPTSTESLRFMARERSLLKGPPTR